MTTCFNCGQEMKVFKDPMKVLDICEAFDDHREDFWEELWEGQVFEDNAFSVTFKVVAIDVDGQRDSYGNPCGSGFVIFQATDGANTKNYKIEGNQSSYGGWEWEPAYITEVSQTPKTVLVWESV